MARQESDREDLFGEATALVRRAELRVSGSQEPIVFGFRRDGGLSVYLGADPVFHFDPAGRLRRGYVGGRLLRTQGSTLAELTRERTAGATVLRRRDLDPQELSRFLEDMKTRLIDPVLALEQGRVAIWKAVPADDTTLSTDFVAFVRAILAAPDQDLLAPRYKGRR